MAAEDVADAIAGIRHEVVNAIIDRFVPPKSAEQNGTSRAWTEAIERDFAVRIDVKGWLRSDENMDEDGLRERMLAEVDQAYEAKVQTYGAPVMRHLEKAIMLQQLDQHWREHLAAMDYLRQGIHLRGYAQKNPKQEYKREAFELFTAMLDRIKHDTVSLLSRMQLRTQEEIDARRGRAPAAPGARDAVPARRAAVAHGARRAGRLPGGRAADSAGAAEPVAQFVRETRRSAATSRARAAPARSTSTATGRWRRGLSGHLVHVVAGALFDSPAACSSRSVRPASTWPEAGNFPAARSSTAKSRATGLRELHEELGVEVLEAAPLIAYEHEYPHRRVLLDLWLVTRYSGEPQRSTRQALQWVPRARRSACWKPTSDDPVLEAEPADDRSAARYY